MDAGNEGREYGAVPVELSFCVVNTDRRALLRYCLDAIARERATVDFETEVLVLDNASEDGSVEAARGHRVTTAVIAQAERRGMGANDDELLRRAQGRYCLLLDGDSELEPGATAALHGALASDERAGAAGAALVRPDGSHQPSAWRFPGPWTSLVCAVRMPPRFAVQSRGDHVRRVDWCPPAALLVRRAAVDQVGGVDRAFVAEGDAADLCKRLAGAGWHTLYVPAARAAHHEPPSADSAANGALTDVDRDLYMRKHHSGVAAALVRLL